MTDSINNDSPNTAPLDNDFWQFSLRHYGRLQQPCLALQASCDANINILLWCLWLAERGVAVDTSLLKDAETAVADWRRQVVLPLRRARQAIKATDRAADRPQTTQPALEPLYRAAKQAELLAEQVEQQQLYALARQHLNLQSTRPPHDPAINLQGYWQQLQLNPDHDDIQQLLKAL